MNTVSHIEPPINQPAHIEQSLADWERRWAAWKYVAKNLGDPDMRALYHCGAACAEKIVKQLRDDLSRDRSSR